MKIQMTAVYQKVPEGYVGFVEELPGANTQGETLEEVKVNLYEAIELIMESNRMIAEKFIFDKDIIREPLFIYETA